MTGFARLAPLFLFAAALSLAGPAAARDNCTADGIESLFDRLADAALGGLLGTAEEKPADKTAATGGALLGGLAGKQMARQLTCRDQHFMYDTVQTGLERYPSGQKATWRNPESGHWGSVMPTNTYRTPAGRNCREFRQTVHTDSRPWTATGTACRRQGGIWKITGK